MRHYRLVHGNYFHRARRTQAAGTPPYGADLSLDVSHLWKCGIFQTNILAFKKMQSLGPRHDLRPFDFLC